ncbi:MAG: hypothetical protein ACRCY9_09660 [Phycicoccus sp.]
MPISDSDLRTDVVRVDLPAVRQFCASVDDEASARLAPHSRRCIRTIDRADAALGADPRFIEARAVRDRGAATTASAEKFLHGLGEHLAVLASDAQRAARQYVHLDTAAAERANAANEHFRMERIGDPASSSCQVVATAVGPSARASSVTCTAPASA